MAHDQGSGADQVPCPLLNGTNDVAN